MITECRKNLSNAQREPAIHLDYVSYWVNWREGLAAVQNIAISSQGLCTGVDPCGDCNCTFGCFLRLRSKFRSLRSQFKTSRQSR